VQDSGRSSPGLRVALVHDWLTGMRGGEKVLAELCELFPDATVHTLVRREQSVSKAIESHPIRTSLIQRLPFARTHYRYYLPLFPLAARLLSIEKPVDLVISSSHAAAKAIVPPPGALHICYCHAPMRYIWDDRGDYFKFGASRHARRLALAPFKGWLRRWDRRTAERVDMFVANSAHVRDRIRAIYGRDATVVHPPVDTEYFTPANGRRDGSGLVVSALVPYKRVDLAVHAFSTTNRVLRVVGTGTERSALERIAGPSVEFLASVSDERLRELYRTSGMLVFPGLEDFGIVPVEAQACGLPVVAFGEGGASETVLDGVTGVFFGEQSVSSLLEAIARRDELLFEPGDLRAHAERFGKARFRRQILDIVADVWDKR
jgi:glycosyltransferase involved in cell wall biosynthesis